MCAIVYVDVHACVCVLSAFTMTGGFARFKTHLHNNVNIHTTQEGLKYYSIVQIIIQPCKGCTCQNSAQLGNDKQPWFIHVVMDATYLGTLTGECKK